MSTWEWEDREWRRRVKEQARDERELLPENIKEMMGELANTGRVNKLYEVVDHGMELLKNRTIGYKDGHFVYTCSFAGDDRVVLFNYFEGEPS